MNDLQRQASRFITDHHVMTLATWAEGDLWAADVFYASSGFDLLFVSSPDSRHGRHVAAKGWAAATISAEVTRWQDIKGVQLEGTTVQLGADEVDAALAVYVTRFPWLREMLRQADPREPALVQMEIAGRAVAVAIWRLRPARLFFLDNSLGFGHRQEVFTCEPVRRDA